MAERNNLSRRVAGGSAERQEDQTQADKFLSLFLSLMPLFRALLGIGLFLLTWWLLFSFLPTLDPPTLTNGIRVLIIVVGGSLPLVLYSYFQNQRAILLNEYKQNLRRLGLPDNAQIYKDKFDAVYGPETRVDRFTTLLQSPIIIATLLSSLGWLIVFYPTDTPGSLMPNPDPLAYGFLGAYLLGIGSLVRQYVTDDLQPRYYASLSYRYLAVFVLSSLLTLLPTAGSGSILLTALVVGLFPATGLRMIQRAVTTTLGPVNEGLTDVYPLNQLEGLNAFHEDRLLLEGIENMQNLVSANVVDLMLKTRYPVEQIIDWMDQALLHLHAQTRLTQLQSSGLRTATDLLDFYNPPGLATDQLDRRRRNLVRILDQRLDGTISDVQIENALTQFEAIITSLQRDPNIYHIRHWRDNQFEALPEDVERKKVIADLKLMQGLPDEAITAYNELLRAFPSYHSALLYRGLAYYRQGEFNEAIKDYSQAIDLGGPHWENARHAFVERGRALRELAAYQEAADNYEQALKIYQEFSEAHLELAVVQMTYLGEYDEAIKHLEVVAEEGFKEAETLANLGLARFERWKQQGRSLESRATELGQAQYELERALVLKPNLIAPYLNLAQVLDEVGQATAALETLNKAIDHLQSNVNADDAYRAHLHRGNLYLQRGDYKAAADDYRVAARLAPQDAAAFFNLGTALQALNDNQAALKAFDEVIQRAPGHALAYQSLGEVAAALDLFDKAENAFSTALRLTRESNDQSGQAQAHLSLGRLYKRLDGRQIDAERELRQATLLDEGLIYTDATYELGLLAMAKGRFAEAVGFLTTSAELFDVLREPRASVRANLQLGRAYLSRQEKDAARDALGKASERLAKIFDPLNPEDQELQATIEGELAQLAPEPQPEDHPASASTPEPK